MVIRVLIVDDSATQRRLMRAALAKDSRLCVIGEAADPYEARARIKALNPDVLTLDIEMPGMKGLDFFTPDHAATANARGCIVESDRSGKRRRH